MATSHCLIPYVDSATASPDVAAALNRMPMKRHIFLLLSHSPGLFPPVMNVYGALFNSETRTIPLLDWQLIVLRIASTLKCNYEWDVNAPVARVHGMSSEVMDQVALCKEIVSGDGQSAFSERQRRILKFVDEQLQMYTNDSATVKSLLEYLSHAELVEAILIIGFYVMIARLVKSVGIDPDGEIPGLDDMIRAGVS
ncbi:MAG: hypothetical protein M1812_005436 [Candelaria pacifica]|nr:MAG: hypothetical protein M1812_005436 [Candelaria pacifica]